MADAAPPRTAAERTARAHAAAAHLGRVDQRFAKIIGHVGVHRLAITRDPYTALLISILQQQISSSAAAALKRRLLAALGAPRFRPAEVLALPEAALRGAGLSRQKAQYVREVSAAFADGRLTARGLRRMSDAEVITATTAIKGVGVWTAEMLLMFSLERPDVWPVGDLGLRKAARLFAGATQEMPPEAVRALAEPWRPYRTYAAWYFWRLLEAKPHPDLRIWAGRRA